jgi:hypothetical protein
MDAPSISMPWSYKRMAFHVAMILVEECKLRLDEPADRLPPELPARRVLKH